MFKYKGMEQDRTDLTICNIKHKSAGQREEKELLNFFALHHFKKNNYCQIGE